MTFLEMYNRVCFKIWGNSAVPQGTQAVLYGEDGIIANVHQEIQRERNYWFMEFEATIDVVAGTRSYALPLRFKELVRCGLRILNPDSTSFERPLSALPVGEAYKSYTNAPTETSDYPDFYEIYGGMFYLYPMPAQNCTMYVRYYKYLPRLVNDADEDTLCINGYNSIIELSCAEMLKIQEEFQKAAVFEQAGRVALATLDDSDMNMRRAENLEIDYRGF